MKNQLTNIKSTNLVLSKSKSLLDITAKILERKGTAISQKKPAQELATHKDIEMINGLMWENDSRKMNWSDAMEYAKNLRLGGYDDWRLPTKEELGNIVTLCGGVVYNCDDDDDVLEKLFMDDKNETLKECYSKLGFSSNDYWSSTTYAGFSDLAWVAYFGSGYQYYRNKTNSFYVRCVRAVQ